MSFDGEGSELGKRAAAAQALEFVRPGMILGLGTGSTASWFIKLLSDQIKKTGLEVLCVPTSKTTEVYARTLKIPLTTFEQIDYVDLIVDGADEFDSELNLIKGGGGALLQEKIVASASKQMVVIADSSKQVSCLGKFDLPVEVVQFGANSTKRFIEKILQKLGYDYGRAHYREDNNKNKFVTDEGHFIIDLVLNKITDSSVLQEHLINCAGVVETGLFLGMANTIIVGNFDGSCKLIGASNI